MKEKTKKIIAGVGLGLMLGTGVSMVSGCSNVEFTQEQIDKMMTVVDNADVFMDENLDLLKSSNQKLDRETAVKLYDYAVTRLYVNKDNVWDNMSINISETGTEDAREHFEGFYHFYKMTNKRVAVGLVKYDGENDYNDGFYIDDVVIDESYQEYLANKGTTQSGQMSSLRPAYTNSYSGRVVAEIKSMLAIGEVNKNTIVDCSVLENGNYKITVSTEGNMVNGIFASSSFEEPILIDCEITPDGFLVSQQYNILINYNGEDGILSVEMCSLVFEYNTLTQDGVQAEIDKYNSLNL